MKTRRIISSLFILFLLSQMAHSQSVLLTAKRSELTPEVKQQLSAYLKDYEIFTIPVSTLNPKDKIKLKFQLKTPLNSWNFEVSPVEILDPQAVVEEFDGKIKKQIKYNYCPTFVGKANGVDDTRFFVYENYLRGTIYEKNNTTIIEPLSWLLGDAKLANVYISYKESDVIETFKAICGVKATEEQIKKSSTYAALNAPPSCKKLRLAIEYDNEFFALGGQNKAIAIVNEMDGIFARDLRLRINLVHIAGWGSSGDPYTNTIVDGPLLGEFTSYWNANQTSISRDATHMFTGKNLSYGPPLPGGTSNGMALLQNICASDQAYSLSDGGNNTTDWAFVACHEIGHNMGYGSHDSDHGIDCDAMGMRYIMCQGNDKNGSFSPYSKSSIIGFLNGATCLTTGEQPSVGFKLDNGSITSGNSFYYIVGGNHTLQVVNYDPNVGINVSYSVSNPAVSYSVSGLNFYFNTNGTTGSFTIQVSVTNSCGTTNYTVTVVVYAAYRVAPNPTKDYVTIVYEMEEKLDNFHSLPVEILLWNDKESIVKSSKPQEIFKAKQMANNKTIIDVRDLKKGEYFLHLIFEDGKKDIVKIVLD